MFGTARNSTEFITGRFAILVLGIILSPVSFNGGAHYVPDASATSSFYQPAVAVEVP